MFQEKVTAIGHWFVEWTEPEQMVLLYSLLKRLTPLQVKLLSRVVDQHVTDCAELQVLEHQANNPAVIGGLLSKRKEVAMQQLLQLLPLLRPGNVDAKSRYLSVIPAVLNHSVETGEHLTEAKSLISYSLIHPAINSEDRKQLAPWVQILKARLHTVTGTPMLPIASDAQQSWRPKEATRVRRSNSLTPPVSLCHSSVELWTGQDDLCAKQKPRSFSLSEHVPPLSPQSSQASSGSGSETQLDDSKTFSSDLPGMKDIGGWLKQLRLHKYVWLFNHLSYEDMMALTEEKLETLGVTKGARHKIVLSIRKLRDRHLTLCQLEKDVNRGANLTAVLEELKAILCSPIKPTSGTTAGTSAGVAATTSTTTTTTSAIATNETAKKTESPALDPTDPDIPALLTKVLGKVCTHLIVNNGREEEPIRLSLWLLDRCLAHEAFISHRRRLETWRMQIHALWQQHNIRHNGGRWYHHTGGLSHHHHVTDTRSLRRPVSSQPSRPGFLLNTQYSVNASLHQPFQHPNGSAPSLSATMHPVAREMANGSAPSLIDATANGASTNMLFPTASGNQRSINQRPEKSNQETDINSTLEDLCLSMAEHFLEGVS